MSIQTQTPPTQTPESPTVGPKFFEDKVSRHFSERPVIDDSITTGYWTEYGGMDQESAETVPSTAEVMSEHHRVAVRMTSSVAMKVLSGQPYTGAHAPTETSNQDLNGALKLLSTRSQRLPDARSYLGHKARKEKEAGIAPAIGEPTLVYGYLEDETTKHHKNIAGRYGEVSMILKPDVIKRSTFSNGDSLLSGSMGSVDSTRASLFREAQSVSSYTAASPGIVASHSRYVEAQIQGGVSLEDVESITLWVPKRRGVADAQALVAKVDEQAPGLPVTIVYPSAQHLEDSVLDLAISHESVTVVLHIDVDAFGSYFTPFEADHQARRHRKLGSDAMFISGLETRARSAWREARQREVELTKHLQDYFLTKYGLEEIPDNVMISISNPNP